MNGGEEKLSWVKKVKITIEGHSIEYLTSSSQKVKLINIMGSQRNCHRQEKSRETWWINATWINAFWIGSQNSKKIVAGS